MTHTLTGYCLIALGLILPAIGVWRSKKTHYPTDRWFT